MWENTGLYGRDREGPRQRRQTNLARFRACHSPAPAPSRALRGPRRQIMSQHRTNFFRFLRYVLPYKKYIVLAALGGMVKFTVPLLFPKLTQHLIDEVFGNAALTPAEKTRELLTLSGGLIALYLVVYAPWTYQRHYFAGKAGHRSVFDLRCDLYYRILRMSHSFFSRNKSGAIVSRLISDIQLAQNLVGSALTNVWMDACALIVLLWFLISIDPPTTAVALATMPLYLYFFKKFGRKIKSASYDVQQEIATMSGNANEKIAGSTIVHAFTQEAREEKAFLRESEKLFRKVMRTITLQGMNITCMSTLTNIAPVIVMLYAGMRVIGERMTGGELVAVLMYLGPLYLPLQRFSELNVIFANSMAAIDRIFEIIDEKPEIADRPNAAALPDVRGRVEFQDVVFGYHDDQPVLRGVSFVAEAGAKVALVGRSGSGKSTLISLIPRFYDVHSGAVRIDGHDVREVKVKSLRQHIAVVLQDPILFSGTIVDNIRYGRPEASDEEVLRACRDANALDFIHELPDGLNTEVGERGGFLSGGQRQRITLARAFLKNPRILLLDEPTSALDSESEHLIQDALERLMKGRTTFIIAHRLSTITGADTILVMEDGRIVEAGSHRELLLAGGIYRQLCEQQYGFARQSIEFISGIAG